MGTIFRGVAPFLVSDILRVLVLVLFPSISLVALWVVG
jgi:TRAP-type mannitol/chloroaromatic compound transport system permease large subunit